MSDDTPILTLEPLLEAVQSGVLEAGWTLSGLQKTTSHQFEGRWEGEATRSAYLFFHLEPGPGNVSIDVFLDETTRGLTGNLALVVALAPLSDLGNVEQALRALAEVGSDALPGEFRTPMSLRFSLSDRDIPASQAETQVRFKVRIPKAGIHEGPAYVQGFAAQCVRAFQAVLASPTLIELTQEE